MTNMAYHLHYITTVLLAPSLPLLMSWGIYIFQVDYIWLLRISFDRNGSSGVNGLFHLHVDEFVCQKTT